MAGGWHFDSWSAISVTLDDISSEPASLYISRASQLRIIDCALPGLVSFGEEKRLEIGLDFCKYVQSRLAGMFFLKYGNYKSFRSAIGCSYKTK